jgi:copper chaperone
MVSLEVKGMSCGHCAAAVTRAIKEIDPAAEVKVDLESGRVEVQGQAAAAAVSKAVDEAGYEVVSVA